MKRAVRVGLLITSLTATASQAASFAFPSILQQGYIPLDLVTPQSFRKAVLPPEQRPGKIQELCRSLTTAFQRYGWLGSPCSQVSWQAELLSHQGAPLLYATFGSGSHTTLILGGVHPDELTPIPMAFKLAEYFAANPALYTPAKDVRVIIAPLVNPDGFLREKPSRTNSHGVDVNRNFFTLDWYHRALSWWQTGEKRRGHFPGHFPNSELETLFQVKLIDEFAPDKILSLHAPLGFLDYDGPGDRLLSGLSSAETKARGLVKEISQKSKNYRIVDYSFYPGSLGNFAGNERNIPTVTLELETTNPKKFSDYWTQFLPGLLNAVDYPYLRQVDKKSTAPKLSSHYGDTESSHESKL